MKAKSCLKHFIVKSVLLSNLLFGSIPVIAQLNARFSGTNIMGCAPILARFHDESTGNPNFWKWDLGNGTISYLQHPSVTYFIPGTYHVKLIIKNAAGQDSLIKSNYVHVYAAPVADFIASQTSGCDSITAQFTDRSNAVNAWQWDFGDGIFSTEHNPVHNYSQTGNYNVSLKVINGEGCSLTLVKQSYINVNTAKAGFNFTIPGRCAPTTIQFQNNSYGNGRLSYKWYYGNGDSSIIENPLYTYPVGGTYSVKLIVFNEFGCTDTYINNINITTPVSASFNADITNSCKAPATVQFTNQALQNNHYTWDFGDSTVSSVSNPVHVYNDTGSYTVKLIIRNSNGCIDSVIKTNYIRIQKPFVSLENLPDSGCTGMSKRLSATSVGTDAITSYRWNFGDGSTSALQNPTHVFTGDRYFNISLITTGVSGCSDTTLIEKAIHTGYKPIADFSSNVQVACAQTKIAFTDNTRGTVTQWQWNFGDNGQAFEQHPQYRFNDTGFLAVELITYNRGCTDTVIRQGYVYIKPSVSKLKFDFRCENPFQFSFTNLAIGADSWLWDFGDGNTSTDRHPVHIYSDTGSYSVSLTTHNVATGCDGYKSKGLMTTKVTPGFFASDSVICKGRATTFTATIADTLVNRFLWYFGDGTVESTLENYVSHEYAEPGNYTITLVTVNRVNCKDSVVKSDYISVKEVQANFGILNAVVCSGAPVEFYDSSQVSSGSTIQSWQWNFGDGNAETFTAPPFTHAYAARGTYPVSLKVTDNNGCSNTFTSNTLVTVRKVYPTFWPDDTIKCSNNEIRFVCPYSEQGVTYSWNFGDGQSSTAQIPRHAYSAEGSYHVKLKVRLQQGCEDSFALSYPIVIEDPVAKFDISDSFRSCPPLIVQFTSESEKTVNEMWNFGYGTEITANNPSHFYSYPGVYDATLTVTGRGGCTSSMQRTIEVKGPKGSLSYAPLNFCQAPANVTFHALTTDATSYTWDFNDGNTVTNTDSVTTHLYNNGGSFIPKLMLVDNEGCRVPVEGVDTIKLAQLQAAFRYGDTSTCSNGHVDFINTTIAADSIVNYHWSFGDGTFADNISNPSHTYAAEGIYYPSLRIIAINGCTDTFTTAIPVRVALSPDISIESSSEDVCATVAVSFDGITNNTQLPVMAWQWDFANGNISSEQHPAEQLFSTAGNYAVKLTATGTNGCNKTIIKNITVRPSPNVTINGGNAICEGSSTTLNAAGAAAYYWQSSTAQLGCNSCTTQMVSPVVNTNYIVKGTNEFGCTAYDTFLVRVMQPFTLDYNSMVKLCEGSNVQLRVGGAEIYEWSPSTGLNNSHTGTPLAQPAETTQYTVIGKDALGCYSDTALITVTVTAKPAVDAGEDKLITAGMSTDLIPLVSADVTSVIWSPTGDIFRNEAHAITVKPLVTTEYTVTVRNANGCAASDKIKVAISSDDPTGGLFVPNTFSPNADGANDIFFPRSGRSIKVNRLKIMNRMGITVFDKTNFYTNDAAAGWDGTFKGTRQHIDVYVYALEIIGTDGKAKVLSGNISLIH